MKIKSSVMIEHQNDLLNIITDKCLGHAKPTIKSKANECIMLMFDCTEAFTEAQDALLGLAGNKNIKVSFLIVRKFNFLDYDMWYITYCKFIRGLWFEKNSI